MYLYVPSLRPDFGWMTVSAGSRRLVQTFDEVSSIRVLCNATGDSEDIFRSWSSPASAGAHTPHAHASTRAVEGQCSTLRAGQAN